MFLEATVVVVVVEVVPVTGLRGDRQYDISEYEYEYDFELSLFLSHFFLSKPSKSAWSTLYCFVLFFFSFALFFRHEKQKINEEFYTKRVNIYET